ncbi:MAG TPA: hypothetical protein VMW08_00705 [Acidimicrobiales bacterium]|nr:hypothetical protein [Acidimicrobiales bacterium]
MSDLETIAVILSAIAFSAITAYRIWQHDQDDHTDTRQLREADARRAAIGRAVTPRPWPEEAHDG